MEMSHSPHVDEQKKSPWHFMIRVSMEHAVSGSSSAHQSPHVYIPSTLDSYWKKLKLMSPNLDNAAYRRNDVIANGPRPMRRTESIKQVVKLPYPENDGVAGREAKRHMRTVNRIRYCSAAGRFKNDYCFAHEKDLPLCAARAAGAPAAYAACTFITLYHDGSAVGTF